MSLCRDVESEPTRVNVGKQSLAGDKGSWNRVFSVLKGDKPTEAEVLFMTALLMITRARNLSRRKSMEAEEVTVSSQAEEYLETIYRLEKKTGAAKTMELARQLKVVPGSITNTIECLERRGLVIHEPYRGTKLTEKGRKVALDVLRRHRLAERLLTDILHIRWSEVHNAACKLEHAIPDEIVKPLEKALGHPQTCSHGNPIPTKCGAIIEEESEPLINLNPPESGTVVKITEEKQEVLEYLATLQLMPGASVEVVEKAPPDGPITVKVKGTRHALSREVATIINVKRT